MNTFNKKSLCVALAATGMLGAAGVAQAVNVSENGLGNVLIYPYYTVNKDINGNSYNTLMSVVNTTAQHEGGQGPLPRRQEQRGSAGLQRLPVPVRRLDRVDHAATAAGGAPDRDVGQVLHDPDVPGGRRRFPYARARDRPTTALTRTAEGYFEVFEMATYTSPATAAKATHVRGVPRLRRSPTTGAPTDAAAAARRPVRRRGHPEPGGRRRVLAKRHGARQFHDRSELPEHRLRPSRTTRTPSRRSAT